jgi:hypothetical protein
MIATRRGHPSDAGRACVSLSSRQEADKAGTAERTRVIRAPLDRYWRAAPCASLRWSLSESGKGAVTVTGSDGVGRLRATTSQDDHPPRGIQTDVRRRDTGRMARHPAVAAVTADRGLGDHRARSARDAGRVDLVVAWVRRPGRRSGDVRAGGLWPDTVGSGTGPVRYRTGRATPPSSHTCGLRT